MMMLSGGGGGKISAHSGTL